MSKKNSGYTLSDMFKTMTELSKSEKLRKKVQKHFKKKGMDITIDSMGVGHLYLPLYVSKVLKPKKVGCNDRLFRYFKS